MEKRFVVPAVSFLAGVFIWIAFFVLYVMDRWVQGPAPWPALAPSLVVSGLILFSAVRCHRAGGPRVGSIVRASVLFLMALLTFWKVGSLAAGVLLLAAIATGTRSTQPDRSGDAGAEAIEKTR